MCTKIVKMFKILEFYDNIWNDYEKCINVRTNMPSIALVCLDKVFQ